MGWLDRDDDIIAGAGNGAGAGIGEGIFESELQGVAGNFARSLCFRRRRDIKAAIKSGWIQTHTPRTYSVTRTGWNRVADAVSKLAT